MNKWLFALIVMMSGIFAPAMAQESNIYYSFGISDASVQVPGNSGRNVGTLAFSVGTQINRRFGLELALGAGSDDPSSFFSESVVQYQALLGRFSHGWANKEVYLLVGHARLDIDSSLNPANGGNAFGFGLNLFGSKNLALNAQVLSIGGEVNTAGLGIQWFVGGVR